MNQIVVSPVSAVESLSERNHVVRERTFPGPDILSVIHRLMLEKFTGRIVIHMGQGGVNAVVAEEQKALNV